MYVVINGMDGSGKDTQALLLARRLQQQGKHVYILQEPGTTDDGEVIRSWLLGKKPINAMIQEMEEMDHSLPWGKYIQQAKQLLETKRNMDGEVEMYLFAAARWSLLKEMKKRKEENAYWIARRSVACSMSYQGHARGMGMDVVWKVNEPALAIYPDLEIFLDISVSEAKKRISKRTKSDRFDQEQEAFFEKVREGYHLFYQNSPYPVVIINGEKDIDTISEEIWKLIQT